MNFKKILAGAAAAVTAAVSLAIPASADLVEKEIAYNGPSANAFTTGDDGVSLRLNLYNTWANPQTTDIDPKGSFADCIEVSFTIEGLGDRYCNYNEDGTEGDAFWANLEGVVGTTAWPETPHTDIKGDGDYTVTFPLDENTNDILCLILQTNINKYSLDDEGAGVKINVTKIKTSEDVYDSPELGDVDANGKINIFDAVAVAKYTVDPSTIPEENLYLADANQDDKINIFDAVMIAKFTVGGPKPEWKAED